MGILQRLLVMIGLFSIVTSQEEYIFRMIQQEPTWVEQGETARVTGQWEQNAPKNLSQQVEWKTKNAGISKTTLGNTQGSFVYFNSPVDNERLEISVDWDGQVIEGDLITQKSVLTILDFKVTDPENYTCEIEIGRQQRSTITRIRAYAKPIVLMIDGTVEVDLRKPPPKVEEPTTQAPVINATEAVLPEEGKLTEGGDDFNSAETVPGDPVLDSELNARKRRQLDNTFDEPQPATFDDSATTETNETKYVGVSCLIENAYPKPSKVVFIIGENEAKVPDDPIAWAQDNATKLYSGEAFLTLEADPMYDGKNVMCRVTIPTEPAMDVTSVNPSSPFVIYHETDKVTTVLSPDIAEEGENVRIECRSNGNPRPKYKLLSTNGKVESGLDEEDSGRFTIWNIGRNQAGTYWCEASSDESEDPASGNTVESEIKPYLEVQYIDEPTLSSGDVVKEMGDSLTVDCTGSGFPNPEASWKKNGELYISRPRLSIEDLKYSHSGVYECVTESHGKIKKASFRLTVEGKCEIDFKKPVTGASKTKGLTYFLRLECAVRGKPDCDVNIVAPKGFEVTGETKRSPGSVTLDYDSVPKLASAVTFACVASNKLTRPFNKTVVIDDSTELCCSSPAASGISTGAIVGILLLVLVIVVGIPVACYLVKKRNAPSKKKRPADAEAGDAEKEGLNREASSETNEEA